MEKKFFETFGIEPFVRKGEKYFTTQFRFAEVRAEMDLWWTINGDKILELEELLGDFSIIRNGDKYIYKLKNSDSEPLSRKDALLDLLVKNVDKYREDVLKLFKK